MLCRLLRDLGQEEFAARLVPEYQFHHTISIIIAKKLVMVLVGSRVLDQVPLPGFCRIVFGMGVFPPPYLVGAAFARKDDVHIAIPVDIVGGGSGFNPLGSFIDHIAIPATYHCICRPPPKELWSVR